MKVLLSKSEKRRHRERARITTYTLAGAASLVVILFGHFFLYASIFKIKSIETSGIVRLDELYPDVLSGLDGRLLGFTNFLAWPSKVQEVKVSKDYSKGVLKLSGPNAEQFAIWCSSGCFWVNRDGVAVAEAPDTEGGTIAKIGDSREFAPIIGKMVLSATSFSAVSGLVSGLGALPLTIASYEYDHELQELTAMPSRGAKLIFSVRFVPSDKLFSSLHNLITSGQIKSASYADFTVENRVYLK